MVNQVRQQNGVGVLADNPLLDQLAMQKALDVANNHYFSDYSSTLGWPINQEQRAGFQAYLMGAENMAEAANLQWAMMLLMASPPHKQNLLDPGFTQTGIAVVPITNGVLVVQFFAGPSY